LRWPDFFPDDCPPDDAEPASGEVYRITGRRNPKNRDFLSYREQRGPDAEFSQPECIVCGLSVYRDIEDISRMRLRRRRVPKLRKRLYIAKGLLNPSLGKIKATGHHEKSHHTWWVPTGVEAWQHFNFFRMLESLEEG
jgi:hypothetical protein